MPRVAARPLFGTFCINFEDFKSVVVRGNDEYRVGDFWFEIAAYAQDKWYSTFSPIYCYHLEQFRRKYDITEFTI